MTDLEAMPDSAQTNRYPRSISPMQNKTPEERSAIAAKGVETRRKNAAARKNARNDLFRYRDILQAEIEELENKLNTLSRMETFSLASASLTSKSLLRPEEIDKSALPWGKATGVYFLLDGNEIVYVGQAVNVYSRISQHTKKKFDRYAYVPCAEEQLDIIESLYIHCLRPKLNGIMSNGLIVAPIQLCDIHIRSTRETVERK